MYVLQGELMEELDDILGGLEQALDVRGLRFAHLRSPSYSLMSGQVSIGSVDFTRYIPASAKRWKAASECGV